MHQKIKYLLTIILFLFCSFSFNVENQTTKRKNDNEIQLKSIKEKDKLIKSAYLDLLSKTMKLSEVGELINCENLSYKNKFNLFDSSFIDYLTLGFYNEKYSKNYYSKNNNLGISFFYNNEKDYLFCINIYTEKETDFLYSIDTFTTECNKKTIDFKFYNNKITMC